MRIVAARVVEFRIVQSRMRAELCQEAMNEGEVGTKFRLLRSFQQGKHGPSEFVKK